FGTALRIRIPLHPHLRLDVSIPNSTQHIAPKAVTKHMQVPPCIYICSTSSTTHVTILQHTHITAILQYQRHLIQGYPHPHPHPPTCMHARSLKNKH
ncbi:hypothetical protein COCVIDRAFT_101905, partial [Bipolaris victoriae FI3]